MLLLAPVCKQLFWVSSVLIHVSTHSVAKQDSIVRRFHNLHIFSLLRDTCGPGRWLSGVKSTCYVHTRTWVQISTSHIKAWHGCRGSCTPSAKEAETGGSVNLSAGSLASDSVRELVWKDHDKELQTPDLNTHVHIPHPHIKMHTTDTRALHSLGLPLLK